MTPVRGALRPESRLLPLVQDGLDGLESSHKAFIATDIRAQFADSLNLDEAMRPGHEQENRWDYLLGHGPTSKVIGLEPHTARLDEISTVIAKKKAAMVQISPHLRAGVRVHAWFWVASGRVLFADTEGARLRLDQAGITFAGKQLLPKHLSSVSTTTRR